MASTQEAFQSQLEDRNFQIGGHTLFFVIVIIITVALLFLYGRWLSRCNNLLPISAPQHSCALDAAKLPITLHLPSSGDTDCCICLGVIEEGDKVKVLPECRHCYHSDCVDMWLFTHSTCPLCRTPLRRNCS